jgi:hypothetical protein
MTVRTIEYLLNKFGAGKSPGSSEYVDLIDTLADDRNAVYFASTAPEDTSANPLWFNTSTQVLSVYSGGNWVTAGGAQGSQGIQGEPGPIGATGPAGDSLLPRLPFRGGRYYTASKSTLQTSGGAGTIHFQPLFIPTTTTFNAIAARVVSYTTAGGSVTVRLGIFNQSGGLPTTVEYDAGLVSLVAPISNTMMPIVGSFTLSPGWYFTAFAQTGTASVAYSANQTADNSSFAYMLPLSTSDNLTQTNSYFSANNQVALQTGFPSINGSTLSQSTSNLPAVFLRTP